MSQYISMEKKKKKKKKKKKPEKLVTLEVVAFPSFYRMVKWNHRVSLEKKHREASDPWGHCFSKFYGINKQFCNESTR